MRAELLDERQPMRRDVDGDDASGTQLRQPLHRITTEATGSDHDRGRPGDQFGQRLLHHVIRGASHVSQRTGDVGVERLQFHQPIGGNDDVRSQPAVGAGSLALAQTANAVVVEAAHAVLAAPTDEVGIGEHRVAGREPVDIIAAACRPIRRFRGPR